MGVVNTTDMRGAWLILRAMRMSRESRIIEIWGEEGEKLNEGLINEADLSPWLLCSNTGNSKSWCCFYPRDTGTCSIYLKI